MNVDFENKYVKIGAVAIVAILLGAMLFAVFGGDKTDNAPQFTVTDIDGNIFNLSSFEGNKVVLLDFMSVTCPSCKEEMPTLVKIHEKYGNKIEMISIDMEGEGSSGENDLRNFMEEYDATWRAAVDEDREVLELYEVTTIVRLIIVDKDGKLTFDETGKTSKSDLIEALDAAIEGKAESIQISSGAGLATLAIGAGMLSFFSPCAFPMLPGYMSYYLAKDQQRAQSNELSEGTDVSWDNFEDEKKKKNNAIKSGILNGIATAMGIVLVFLVIGILVSISGELAKDHIEKIEPVIGLVLIALGIMMVENIPIGQYFKNAWYYLKYYLSKGDETDEYGKLVEPKPGVGSKIGGGFERLISKATGKEFSFEKAKNEGYFGLFMFGIGYGGASVGCTLPIFLAVILAALDSGGIVKGFYIFMLYAFSMGLMMVLMTVMIAMSKDTLMRKLSSATGKIEMAGGICLQIVGLYLIWYSLNL